MLGQNNPIKYYGEVTLYEDEFADRGFSKSNVRCRVMDNCFFVLLRSYIRIDQVAVRILDTRVFHQFGSDCIIRDFTHLESTYSELKQKGFSFNSQWLLSPSQSDMIYD
jgi:type 2A phosphatase activator TIP41